MPIAAECQDSAEHKSGPYKVQVLDRAVAILDLLACSGCEMSLVALTDAIGLHKSTVHRLLKVMDAHRLVERSPLTGRYHLGMKLFELGSRAVDNLHIRERLRSRLERLAADTGEAVQLSVMDRGEILCIDRIEPERGVPVPMFPGHRYGICCTAAGKAMLACLPENIVREILSQRGTPGVPPCAPAEASAIFADLPLIRERGYAMEFDEAGSNASSVAAALPGIAYRTGIAYPLAAISISGPACKFTSANIQTLAKKLCEAARDLSTLLASPIPRMEAVEL